MELNRFSWLKDFLGTGKRAVFRLHRPVIDTDTQKPTKTQETALEGFSNDIR